MESVGREGGKKGREREGEEGEGRGGRRKDVHIYGHSVQALVSFPCAWDHGSHVQQNERLSAA